MAPTLFIVFSDDWGVHPSSAQHLFRRIAELHPVLWVNTIGMRSPKLTLADVRKVMSKGLRMLRGVKGARFRKADPRKGVRVNQPPMFPFTGIRCVRQLNRILVRRNLQATLLEFPGYRRIVVSTVPNACDFIDDLSPDQVIYYCVDDFSQWPGLNHDLVRKMEDTLVQRANLVLATSRKLHESMSQTGKPTMLFQHGVDYQLFSTKAAAEHEVLRGMARPRFGFFGLIDERSNLELLAEVAGLMPDCSFVLAGPITTDIDGLLSTRPNVHAVGKVAYGDLPALISGLDVLILPYRINSLTATISPLKLKEYLATGRPVVATPIAEVLAYSQFIKLASGAKEWREALESCMSDQPDAGRSACATTLREESWERKAEIFLGWMEEHCEE